MCDRGTGKPLDRRDMLALAGLSLLAGMGAVGPDKAVAASGDPQSAMPSPDEALRRLKDGNARFVSNPELCSVDLVRRRTATVQTQKPFATILSCSDSRVPPELLFGGLGVGEIFVARNAGNMVDTATMGSIEYGATALGVPLIVVLGHERCGAVAAAREMEVKKTVFPGSIGEMLKPILPAVRAAQEQPGDFLANAIRESARMTAARIATQSPLIKPLVDDGRVKVVSAFYSLESGAVTFLPG